MNHLVAQAEYDLRAIYTEVEFAFEFFQYVHWYGIMVWKCLNMCPIS